jgi:hypothetical protein
MFDYLDRLPDEELSQAIDDLGLGGHTFVDVIHEVLEAISSPTISRILIRTRGKLRGPVAVRSALARWRECFMEKWGGRGISVEVFFQPQVHTRRCVL